MSFKNLMVGIAALALLLLNGCNVRAKPVMEEVGVLELPYTAHSLAWHPDGRLLAVGDFMHDVVEVWDVQTKKPVFSVPSKRWVGNQSGQDLLFTSDGKFLIVPDYQDLKPEDLEAPKNTDKTAEIAAQSDKDQYVLARVWDVAQRKEVAQIKGPGARRLGAAPRAMCMLANSHTLAVLRATGISKYRLPSGALEGELDLEHPFPDQPQVGRSYETMACNPANDEVSLAALQFFRDAEKFGMTNWTGATALVVADLERNTLKKVLFSATPLNGVAYSADGGKLVSFGMSPIRVWDVNKGFAALGEIENPPQLDWVATQRTPVDVLHPPANAPRGNSGDLTAVPGSEVMVGLASDFHFWDTSQRRIVATVPSPRDLSRLAMYKPSATLAAIEIHRVHFYRIDAAALQLLTKGE